MATKKINFLVFILILLYSSCTNKEPSTNKSSDTLFSTITANESGIQFTNTLTYHENLNIIDYLYYYNGGGVAIGDINNDGLEDIYFTANQLPDKLYLNKGDLTFEDISDRAGISKIASWSTGATMEDLNNDGLLDIHVSKVGVFNESISNEVYINQGNLKFKESAKTLGLNFKGFSTQSAFLDYDQDGDLDMYLLNHSVHTPRSYGKIAKRHEKDSLSGDIFYENKLNEGTFIFEDVTEKVGIYSSALGYGLGINASDINGDGLIDIYVSNDFHENDYLYINTGNKSFIESSSTYLPHTSRFSMGMDIGDLNGDNFPDIFTLDMMPYDREIFLKSGGEDSDKVSQIKNSFGYQNQYARNSMQINQGNSFSDIALMTSTHATDWSWSALIQDFDNDGKNDIFVTNGIYKRPNDLDYINYLSNSDFSEYANDNKAEIEKQLIEKMPSFKTPNILFKNKGNNTFNRLTSEIGLYPTFSNGAAYADLDNDGDLDVIVNNINEPASILKNNTSSPNNEKKYIQISLKTNSLLKNTSGSKVVVFAQNQNQMKQLSATRGFQSSSTRTLHFGLGEVNKIDSIQVIWPDNQMQIEKQTSINTRMVIEKNNQTSINNYQLKTKKNAISKFPYVHFEDDYLDYAREPLMPEKLSTEGPALVYEDLTGDNIKDIFIGGARYQKPSFYKGLANGTFKLTNILTFTKDEKYEDVDAVAFDLENDGDLDLYIQSGGNDKLEGDPLLEDRMYINLGNGNFERISSQLPSTNGGSVAAGDYNNDGFIDLFVGARSIPGAYGLSPVSLILQNNKEGGFIVVAQDKTGMVTDSEWADMNNDGYKDLIIVGDWMPVTILLNQKNGKFKYRTPNLGLSKTSGFWNTIEIIDVDGNGFLDILAGNVGENFKWKASPEKPVNLYIDDFDDNEQQDPIIFYPLFENYVPFTNRANLNRQLPYLAKKYKNYSEFSKVTSIETLTNKPINDISVKKEIQELRSMLYLNNGDTLLGYPLPKTAQISTIQDFEVYNKNILYVGNYKGFVTELGNSDGNSGGILYNFSVKEHINHSSLDLPRSLAYRKIIHLKNESFLVISNDGVAYLLNKQDLTLNK